MPYVPSDEQRAVIDSTAPVVVVLGGAGAGKTTTAAARRLADDDARRADIRRGTPIGLPPTIPPAQRVLFLSFSRTSVSQIDRATSVLGAYQNRIDVVTFHGLAWRVLKDFGRHYGAPRPLRVRSAAETQLGVDLPGLTYDELIPAAARIPKVPTVAEFYERRCSTVICDEFQDTSDEEWKFMQAIAPSAQRLLLGDVNQCISAGMKQIDPAARVAQVLALPGAEQVLLPPQSHRDPSGVLPAAAQAALERRFDDPAIADAVRGGRLIVHRASSDDIAAVRCRSRARTLGAVLAAVDHLGKTWSDLRKR